MSRACAPLTLFRASITSCVLRFSHSSTISCAFTFLTNKLSFIHYVSRIHTSYQQTLAYSQRLAHSRLSSTTRSFTTSRSFTLFICKLSLIYNVSRILASYKLSLIHIISSIHSSYWQTLKHPQSPTHSRFLPANCDAYTTHSCASTSVFPQIHGIHTTDLQIVVYPRHLRTNYCACANEV